SVTNATGPSYHGPRAPSRAYHFVTYTVEPRGRPPRDLICGEHEGGVTAPAVLVRDRRGGTSDRLGSHSPRLVPDRVQLDSDHWPAIPAADNLGLPAGRRDPADRPPAGVRGGRLVRARGARRVPADAQGRVVRLHRGADDRRHRRRDHRYSNLRRARRRRGIRPGYRPPGPA